LRGRFGRAAAHALADSTLERFVRAVDGGKLRARLIVEPLDFLSSQERPK
jgi:hypothetical protein